MNNHLKYRAEIDGLRAVAIVAVVLFHIGFGCPGGYVGVDIFFVISGFLITSLILRDLYAGTFSFVQFWERRARRILPALVVVTLVTLAVGWVLLRPADFAGLGKAAASQALFAANVYSWRDSGYFGGEAAEKPLLHTWSLSVEEQFYLIVPFLLWGIFTCFRKHARPFLIGLLTLTFLFSLGLSVYLLPRAPWAVFFLLPTRAWELLMGAFVAFLPVSSPILRYRAVREIFSIVGVGLVAVPIALYTSATPFPGLAAIPPCLGTAFIIWSNNRSDNEILTAVGKFLAIRPVAFIGLISYSLYLWHWPIIAYCNYLNIFKPPVSDRLVTLVLSVLFGILSWKYVETPFRKRQLASSRKAIFSWGAIGSAFILICGVLCDRTQGFPSRFNEQVQRYAHAKVEVDLTKDLKTSDITKGNYVHLGVDNANLRPTVFVWGDSHAMAALPAIDDFLKEKGVAGRAATRASTAPVVDKYNDDRREFNKDILSYVRKEHFKDVLLVARWDGYVHEANDQSIEGPLLQTVKEITAAGSRVWVLLDVPAQPFDVPKALAISVGKHLDWASISAKPAGADELCKNDSQMLTKIRDAGGFVLNPKPRFLDATGKYYVVERQKRSLYYDDNHLTPIGARIMLLPLLREAVSLKP